MTWTDERVDVLKRLWSEGLSASQIADRIGSISRNAVIGKVHRLGLAGRANTARPKTPRTVRRDPSKEARPMRTRVSGGHQFGAPAFELAVDKVDAAYEEIVIPLDERKTVLDLLEGHCRWPIGDPQHTDFHFCGHKKVPGLPYCERHAARAFQPAQPRRRDFTMTPAPHRRPGAPAASPIEVSRVDDEDQKSDA